MIFLNESELSHYKLYKLNNDISSSPSKDQECIEIKQSNKKLKQYTFFHSLNNVPFCVFFQSVNINGLCIWTGTKFV